jgi:hypothetical protein
MVRAYASGSGPDDWLSPMSSPALVKLPASATFRKIRILSQSTAVIPAVPGAMVRAYASGSGPDPAGRTSGAGMTAVDWDKISAPAPGR